MAPTITSSPFPIDWVGNNNNFKIQCHNGIVSVGSAAAFVLRATAGATFPSPSYHVVVSLNDIDVVFEVVNEASTDLYKVTSVVDLFEKISMSPIFTKYFRVDTFVRGTRIDLIGREVGRWSVKVFVTNDFGEIDTTYDIVTILVSSYGSDVVRRENYALRARFSLITNNNNQVSVNDLPDVIAQPDENDMVEVPISMLRTYKPQPDLPRGDLGSDAWELLTNYIMKYGLYYSEVWGNPAMPQEEHHTSEYYLFCGEVAERFAAVNYPDWDNSNSVVPFSSTASGFRIIGEPTGETRRVCKSAPQYIYGIYFNTDENAPNIDVVIRGEARRLDGAETVNVKNGSVFRIPVGPSALFDGMFKFSYTYKVTISVDNTEIWSRDYFVVPDLHDQITLLMVNKYGLLHPFVFSDVKRTIDRQAEEVYLDRFRYFSNVRGTELMTVNSPMLSKKEAADLARCLAGEYQYMWVDETWLRITIAKGSFKVLDTEEDMLRVEFSFAFVENQIETLTPASLPVYNPGTKLDANNEIVEFYGRIEPENNELL